MKGSFPLRESLIGRVQIKDFIGKPHFYSEGSSELVSPDLPTWALENEFKM